MRMARARYYDPHTGRFVSEDTVRGVSRKYPNGQELVDPLSLNLYTYCHNNPVRFVDPSGHTPYTHNLDSGGFGFAATPFTIDMVYAAVGFVPFGFVVQFLIDANWALMGYQPINRDASSDIVSITGFTAGALSLLKRKGIPIIANVISVVDVFSVFSNKSDIEMDVIIDDLFRSHLYSDTREEVIEKYTTIRTAIASNLVQGNIELYTYQGETKTMYDEVLGCNILFIKGNEYFRALNEAGKGSLLFDFTPKHLLPLPAPIDEGPVWRNPKVTEL